MQIRAILRRRVARVVDMLPGATTLYLLGARMPSRVRKDSQFLLDGYPRSANTLACFRVQIRNPGLQFAHHTHKPSQLKKASRLGIPLIVLVRNPLDAVRSLVREDPRAYEANECLKDYIRFYESSLSLQSDRVQFVKFETVVGSKSEVFSRLLGASIGIEVASVDVAKQQVGPHLEGLGYENYVNRIAGINAAGSDGVDRADFDLSFNPDPKLLSEATEIYKQVLRKAV